MALLVGLVGADTLFVWRRECLEVSIFGIFFIFYDDKHTPPIETMVDFRFTKPEALTLVAMRYEHFEPTRNL